MFKIITLSLLTVAFDECYRNYAIFTLNFFMSSAQHIVASNCRVSVTDIFIRMKIAASSSVSLKLN